MSCHYSHAALSDIGYFIICFISLKIEFKCWLDVLISPMLQLWISSKRWISFHNKYYRHLPYGCLIKWRQLLLVYMHCLIDYARTRHWVGSRLNISVAECHFPALPSTARPLISTKCCSWRIGDPEWHGGGGLQQGEEIGENCLFTLDPPHWVQSGKLYC